MVSPRVRNLLADESGMTLVELLNVLVLMGILLLMAVPSYLGLKDRSNQAAAKSNLRSIVPAVVLYGTDNQPNSPLDPDNNPATTGYMAMTPTLLQTHYDPTLDPTKYAIANTSDSSYCIYTWVDAWTASKNGPNAPINITLNSSFNPATCS